MGSFGEKLKREREMRAITLEEIAEATKIGTRSLRALEEERFDQLPGGIFNKGFVRAYAKFLGIDEEQAVADYLSATGDVAGNTTTQLAALADQVEQQRVAREAAENGGNTTLMLAAVIALVVLFGIGFGGYKAWKYRQQQQEMRATAAARIRQAPPPVTVPAPNPSTDTNAMPVAPATAPATTGGSSQTPAGTTVPAPSAPTATTPSNVKVGATSTPTPSNFPIQVTVKALKRSWILVKADGKTVYQQTMDPADPTKSEVTLHGNEKIQLVMGNPAGVEVSFNGKPLGTLGPENQRREVTITPQGVER